MATLPTTSLFVAGEKPTAAKMNANGKTALDFILNPPTFKLKRIAVHALNNATWTDISPDTEVFDTDNMWTSGTSVTVKTPGIWLLVAQGGYASNTTGRRFLRMMVNGVQIGQTTIAMPASGSPSGVVTSIERLNVNDVITFGMYQDSGAVLNTDVSNIPAITGIWQGM